MPVADLDEIRAKVGSEIGVSPWIEIDQQSIDTFADVTGDHQFIHIDPAAAAQTPFGGTVAHGFLTLSLLSHLASTIPQDPKTLEGILMGVNYGFDKVRFVNPVKVGSRIRASSVLSAVDQKDPSTLQVTRTMTVEIDGEDKPACVAEWVTRLVYG